MNPVIEWQSAAPGGEAHAVKALEGPVATMECGLKLRQGHPADNRRKCKRCRRTLLFAGGKGRT